MGKKPKSETCSKKGWCDNHLLVLCPKNPGLYFKKSQKIRLCPKLNKITNHFSSNVPHVNKDKKFYTPSFILQQEQNFYAQNDQQMQRNHNERAIDLGQGLTKTIMVANNIRKRKYCSVCGHQYEDYLEHIKTQFHKFNANNNSYTRYILELEQKYKKNRAIIIKQVDRIIWDETFDDVHKVTQLQYRLPSNQSQDKIQL